MHYLLFTTALRDFKQLEFLIYVMKSELLQPLAIHKLTGLNKTFIFI